MGNESFGLIFKQFPVENNEVDDVMIAKYNSF